MRLLLPYNPAPVVAVTPPDSSVEPTVLDRPDHIVSRRNIDSDAQKVLYRLEQAGFETYLVGGGVRDLLLRRRPKDYDVATSARPEEIRRLFRNSRIIGRRFRLAHVYFRGGIVEVSTFRAPPDRSEQRGGPQDLLVTNDNTYGTPREDAFRRDFTINALYYRVSDYAVVDYVGGLKDLDLRIVRVIGDPDVRFREDPVRMLRCCEIAARLGFRIEPMAQESIRRNRRELEKAAAPRIREELFQILHSGAAGPALQLMLELGLLELLFPEGLAMVEAEAAGLGSLDRVVPLLDRGRPGRLDEVILLATILAPSVYAEVAATRDKGTRPVRARDAVHAATSDFMKRLAVPNAKSLRATRALEVLLRLQKLPKNPEQRSRVTRFAAFEDALKVMRLLCRATGEGEDLYRAWKKEAREGREDRPTKRRRRRRRRA